MKYYFRGASAFRRHDHVEANFLKPPSIQSRRSSEAFTVKGVAISHTFLSLYQWILLALYFYLILYLLVSSERLWYALLVFEETTIMASQWGLYLVTKPAFLLQFPGCKGFWLIGRQAVLAFLGPQSQCTHVCRSKWSLLKKAAAPPCYGTSFCGFSPSHTRS